VPTGDRTSNSADSTGGPRPNRGNVTTETPQPFICLACGGPIARTLANAGSPRCHDCRETDAPLRVDFFTKRQLTADRRLPEAA